MKKIIFIIILILILLVLIFFWQMKKREEIIVSPLATGLKKSTPLNQYSFENLAKRAYIGSEIKLGRVLKNEQSFSSYIFYYQSSGKTISGLINLPKSEPSIAGFPVIIMIRGYVDQENYYTGLGTQKPAEYFANNGFITLAPDFIGYGESEPQLDPDILVDRFQKPVEVLELIVSVKNLVPTSRRDYFINPEKIGIWGHSNGGQIALSVLEILSMMEKPIVIPKLPVVLWAPVTTAFPDSILGYSRELDDQGLKVKARVDDFLLDYDAKKFSIANYFDKIQAIMEVHQGGADDLVEISQTTNFVKQLESMGKSVAYFTYPKSDHNLKPDWDLAVERSLQFFQNMLR